jgi:CDP-diacylglycerol--serine O-phosphatidyltransferase
MTNNKLSTQESTPLISLIPNVVTLTSLCIALTSVKFAINQDFIMATFFLLFAGFMDGLDGRLARYLNSESEFGAQLDSLVDFVNFGVVPGIIIYFWINADYDIKFFDWALVLFFAVSAAVRLARFNVDNSLNDNNCKLNKYFFKGIPAPVGAALSMLPLVLTFEFGAGFYNDPYIIMTYVAIISFMMASTIATFSIKKIPIRNEFYYLTIIILSIIIIGLLLETWLSLAVIGIIYCASIPIAIITNLSIIRKGK